MLTSTQTLVVKTITMETMMFRNGKKGLRAFTEDPSSWQCRATIIKPMFLSIELAC